MAEVKLTVRTNFTEAEKELQKLGGTVQTTMKTMTEAEKALASKNIDQYLEKQSRLASAMSITRGQADSNIIVQRNLRNEYEKLYRQGIDPTSTGMIKLENELQRVSDATIANTQSTRDNADQLERAKIGREQVANAAIASLAAIGALSVAMIANTGDVAKHIDAMDEAASSLGMTAQEYQSLSFVAERTGASMEGMDKAIQKMNVGIGQARDGGGQLFETLSKSNPQLLDQITNAESSADAFALMVDAIGNTENPYDRAALSAVAFGKGNREIINTAIAGGESVRGLIDESVRYGIVSDSMVEKSGAWDDAQKNLHSSVFGFRMFMAEKLMPAMTIVMQGFADFISNTDNLKKIMIIATPFVAAFTIAIVGLLIATKAGAAIGILTSAMAALNAVLLANPAIAITAAIVGIVAAIILVVRNWDWCQKQLTIGINYLKGAFAELGLAIIRNISEPLATIADAGRDIPLLGKFFGEQADALATVNDYLKENATIMRDNAVQSIISAENELEAVKRLKEAEKLKNEIVSGGGGIYSGTKTVGASKAVSSGEKPEEEKVNTARELTALSDKLSFFENKEAIHKQNLLGQWDTFYSARMDQDMVKSEEKIAFLESEQAKIMDLGILSAEEEIALKQYTADKIMEIEKANATASYNMMKTRISNVGGFFADLQTIAKNTGKESRGLAILLKGVALAQIGMDTAVSVMASAKMGFPLAIPFVAMSLATGAAAASSVISQKIPSAETGIRDFTVPDSTRVDASYLRVNRDEKVSVTPRGEDSSKMQQTTVMLDGRVILKTVQEFFDNGELRVNSFNVAGAY